MLKKIIAISIILTSISAFCCSRDFTDSENERFVDMVNLTMPNTPEKTEASIKNILKNHLVKKNPEKM